MDLFTMSTGGNHGLAPFHLLERISASVPAVLRLDEEIHKALSRLQIPAGRLRGKSIAVTVGSRGVASVKEIARGICGWLQDQGAQPFVFPAMGSHGGATAEGQRAILASYGVTPEFVGAEIRASMETVSLGTTEEGFPVFIDRRAWEADGIVVMNRAKPHTTFSGKIESGLLKMMAVGMGKAEGARECHERFRQHGYENVIRAVSAKTLASGKILCGVAVVENELHQICSLGAALPEEIVALDESSLARARTLVPRLPFPKIQLLIVNEMGKNISGTGLDTKVIGRGVPLQPGEAPQIDLIYARDLTLQSGGNALGVGLVDFVHDRVRRQIDFEKMYVNARTSMSHHLVRLPMVLGTDGEMISFALRFLGDPSPAAQRVVWIQNTQVLDRLAVSELMAHEVGELPGWRLKPESFEAPLDAEGNLATAF